MKVVQLSEKDRNIIRASVESTAIGNATIDDCRNLLRAQDALKIDELDRTKRIEDLSATAEEYRLEDAQFAAIKKLVEGDGKKGLSKLAMRDYVNCVDHMSVAKDVEKE